MIRKPDSNEEQVDPRPAEVAEDAVQQRLDARVVADHGRVEEQHHQDRDAAQSVEGGRRPCRLAESACDPTRSWYRSGVTPSGVRTRGPRPFEIVASRGSSGSRYFWHSSAHRRASHPWPARRGCSSSLVPATLVIGLALQALHRWAVGDDVRAMLRAATDGGALLLWLRLWLAVAMTSYAYFWLKVSVPLLNDASWDEALWDLDRFLHFGCVTEYAGGRLGLTVAGAATARRLLRAVAAEHRRGHVLLQRPGRTRPCAAPSCCRACCCG